MKIKLHIFVISAFLLVFGGCAAAGFAQAEPIMTGAYAKAEISDSNIVTAANFAVRKQGRTTRSNIRLVAVKSAETQIVAGMNYRLCIEVSVKKKGRKTAAQFVQAVVYRSLKDVFSLTSWTPEACTEQ